MIIFAIASRKHRRFSGRFLREKKKVGHYSTSPRSGRPLINDRSESVNETSIRRRRRRRDRAALKRNIKLRFRFAFSSQVRV
jgi:hypothetical protein